MRIKFELLKTQNGLLCWNGQPFTGVAYTNGSSGAIESIDLFAAGNRTGELIDESLGQVRVLDDRIDWSEEEERMYFNGRPFVGVAYVFSEEGFLISEIGEAYAKEWYENGVQKSFASFTGKTNCSWYQDGSIMRKCDASGLEYAYDPDGLLKYLEVTAGNQHLVSRQTHLRLSPITTLVGVGDDLFCQLLELHQLTHLTLERTRISKAGLQALSSCTRLRRLRIAKNSGFTAEDCDSVISNIRAESEAEKCKLLDDDAFNTK